MASSFVALLAGKTLQVIHLSKGTTMKIKYFASMIVCVALSLCAIPVFAGDYSPGKGGPDEAAYVDAGIAGFVGPAGIGVAADGTNGNYVNPVFSGWATTIVNYDPAFNVSDSWKNGSSAVLGPATGSVGSVAVLGDMNSAQIAAWKSDPANNHGPGSITLSFAHPIANGPGADFAAFENGFVSNYSTGAGSTAGQMFAELGYVQVSTDGVHFAQFPSIYQNYPNANLSTRQDSKIDLDGSGTLTNTSYLTQDVSGIYNLVGKHANGYGASFGTPFNLDDLASNPLVLNGTVNLNQINYVRVVDIPGSGDFVDSQGHPIFDAWVTGGSGGLDLEAVGAIHFAGKTLDANWNNSTDAGTLAFVDGNTTLANPVTANSLQFNGGYRLDGAAVTLSAAHPTISLNDPTATAVIASDLLGSNGLTKSGGGTIVFEGAKSYTGQTIVEAGTLKGTPDSLARDITNNGTVELTVDSTATFANTISGTGNLRLSGGGVLAIATPQTYTGQTQIQAGTLRLGADNIFADASLVDIAVGGTLSLNGHSNTIGGLTGVGQVALDGGTLTLGTNPNAFAGSIGGSGNIVVASGNNSTPALTGANSFTGTVTLQSGSLTINSDAGLGNVSNPIQFSGGTLAIAGTDMHSTSHPLVVDNGGELKIKVSESTNTFHLGDLAGNFALGLYGPGTVTLSGTNTFSGGVTLDYGTLEISSQNQLGTGTLSFVGGTLRITGTSIHTLTQPLSGSSFLIDVADPSNTYTVGSEFNGSGTLSKYGTGNMVVSSSASRTGTTNVYAGTMSIENSAALGGNAYVRNNGTLILHSGVATGNKIYVYDQGLLNMDGNASSTGRVYLYNQSTLVLGDNASISGLTVSSGSTLAGNGLVKGAASFPSQSILSPGALGDTGTLDFQNVTLTMKTGSIYRYEFNALGGDLVHGIGATDTLTLQTGGIIDLESLDGTAPSGKWLTLFDGFETVNGSLSDWTIRYGGRDYPAQFSQQGGAIAVMVPEPSTIAILLTATAVVLGGAWQCRKRFAHAVIPSDRF
jgi:autotransporter-associated beta strand protein